MTGIDARFLPAVGGADRAETGDLDFAVEALAVRLGGAGLAGLAALATGRLRAVPRGAVARGAGLREGFAVFFAVFFAARRLGVAFRAAVFRVAPRLRTAALRPPLVFLPACRTAFRLAIGRPFQSCSGGRSLP